MTQDHRETAGWSKIQDPKKVDEGPKQPEIIQHQCSYCGAMNRIPKPKRAPVLYWQAPTCGFFLARLTFLAVHQ